MIHLANSGYPTASGLGLHFLPMFHEKNARLKWVNSGSTFISEL